MDSHPDDCLDKIAALLVPPNHSRMSFIEMLEVV